MSTYDTLIAEQFAEYEARIAKQRATMAELQRQLEAAQADAANIREIAMEMFAAAALDGLYVGAGYNHHLPRDEQEGPLVKRLRAAIAASAKP